MTRFTTLMMVFMAVSFSAVRAHAGLTEIGFSSAPITDGGYASGIIDTTDGFIAFGSSASYVSGFSTVSAVSEFTISPAFAYSTSHSLFNLLTDLTVGVFDPGTGFSYWASTGTPAALTQIHLVAPVSLSSTTFSA